MRQGAGWRRRLFRGAQLGAGFTAHTREMPMLALISGCAATRLSAEERTFFARCEPWGLVLFRRNIDTPEQVAALCADFRAAVGRSGAPVFVDQEGGRVQRLGSPHWPVYPAAALYAEATTCR